MGTLLKWSNRPVSLTVALLVATAIGVADPPAAVPPIVSIESLKAAANWELSAIDQALRGQDEKVAPSSRMLACFGQSMGDHPQRNKIASNGYALRDAAVAIAAASTRDGAAKALAAAREAHAGRTPHERVLATPSERIISLHDVMQEFERRLGKLRTALRKKIPDRAEADALATGLIVLSLSLQPEKQTPKPSYDSPRWESFVIEHRDQARGLAAALKANDPPAAIDRMIAMRTNCTACHKIYRR